MKKILICTHSQGKFIEISTLLKDLPVEVISLDDVGISFDVDETGETYQENAILKAKTYGQKAGLISIADDTGLEVDALDGKPGVHSKRFFKTNGEERNQELLGLIGDNPQKGARFVASIAVYNPETSESKTFEGQTEGEIISTPDGEAHKDLGYDSIFNSEDLGKTFAQATLAEKNQISHRARAVKASFDYIKTLL